MTLKVITCAHFAPHGSGILQAGYAIMDAYKDKCWWCEIERLRTGIAETVAWIDARDTRGHSDLCAVGNTLRQLLRGASETILKDGQ